MTKIYESADELIGRTPLVALHKIQEKENEKSEQSI